MRYSAPKEGWADLLKRRAHQHPDRPLIVGYGLSITWQEGLNRAVSFSEELKTQGIGEGDRVALLVSTEPEAVIALMAILFAGACSAPINVTLDDGAVNRLLDDSAPKTLILAPNQRDRSLKLPASLGKTYLLSDLDQFPASPAEWAPPETAPDAPMNIIYSSGTTALPKGIMQSFNARMNWAYELSICLRYGPAAQTLFTIGFYSNISWVGLLCTWLVGGTIILEKGFNPEHVWQRISREQITNASMVPVQYERLLEVFNPAHHTIRSMQGFMCCGAPLKLPLKKELAHLLGPAFIELYGLTEGLITTIDGIQITDELLTSVGWPTPATDIAILGENKQTLPAGETGEIIGRSTYIMTEYFRKDQATSDVTWTDDHGHSWLRTGDVGHMGENGALFVTDRLKDMILSGGQNIYPRDLEAALLQHEAVSDVAVIGVPSQAWGETALAVIVRHPSAIANKATILDFANKLLGRHQKIRHAVFIEQLPRNAAGKILKASLRKNYKGHMYD